MRGPFSCFIHTDAGLDTGCQMVSEFIILGEIMGEFFKPAKSVFIPEKLVEEIDKVTINYR